MKTKKIFVVSLLLLAIMTLGAVSAADDTAADLAVEDAGDLDLEVPADEISTDGDTDAAVGENATNEIIEKSTDEVLGVGQEDKLSKVDPTVTHSIDLPKSGTKYVAQWGQSIVVSADYGNATGNVTISFAGETYQTNLIDGAFIYTISKYKEVKNNQVLKVEYNGDENYNSVSFEEKINIRADISVISDRFGQSAYVNVNLYNATGNVTFSVNGVTYRKELLNGTTFQEFKTYNFDSNTVEFAYEGDDNYNPITRSLSFYIDRDFVTTGAVFGQSAYVNVNLYDATGNVTFTVNGVTYIQELVNGRAVQEIKNYKLGSNTVTVSYEGDGVYNASSTSVSFTVQLNDLAATGANFGQPAHVNVNLYNATGNVTFTVNGVTYRQELVNGTAVQEIKNYKLGSNTVSFAYDGDYGTATKSVTFTTTANIDAPVTYNPQPAIITVYLGEATGNVTFTFGSDTQTVGIANGSATYKTTNYTIGENTVSISYSGDDTFKAFTTSKKFTVSEKENVTILSSVYKTADKNMIIIAIPYGTGNVNATINGKKEVLELVDGLATYDINASDVITEINVAYDGNYRFNPGYESNFVKLENNIVTNETFNYYFNQAKGGQLYDFIEDGATLDFQGSVIDSDTSKNIFIDINKPVNIISTTGDGLIAFNRVSVSVNGYSANSFIISNGGSWSNITGISIYNTGISIKNATHVVFDNINFTRQDTTQFGSFSLSTNTTYFTLKNSYLYAKNIIGTSIVILTQADYCTFDNNTFAHNPAAIFFNYGRVTGVDYTKMNNYNNFTNNKFYGENGEEILLKLTGIGNIFENNTFDNPNISNSGTNASFIGNTINGGSASVGNGAIVHDNYILNGASLSGGLRVYDNYVDGALKGGLIVYDNIVSGIMTVGLGAEVYNNTVGGLDLGSNSLVHDNVITGPTTIVSISNAQIYNNIFLGDNAITFNYGVNNTFVNNEIVGNFEFLNAFSKYCKIINNTVTTSADYAVDLKTFTFTLNNISGNILYSAKGLGNNAVNHANDPTLTVENNRPSVGAEIIVAVDNIKVGETAVINITSNETAMGTVEVTVNGEKYTVNLTKGKGTLELKDLLSGEYDVSVMSTDLIYGAQNATSFNVTKNNPTISVDAPAKTQWINSNITVTIADATGDVTLTMNGTDFTSELVDGIAVFVVPDFVYGTYDFNVTYAGDYKYFGNATNGTLTVNRNKEVKIIASDIVEYKLVDEFVAKFINYIGEGIANANVTIKIGNAVYPLVTDENGTAIADLALTRGKYSVSVEFIAIEDEYDAATAEYNITVIDASVIRIISVDEEGLITGSLSDALNAPIANATIVATMNETVANLTTDGTGLFEFQAEDGCKVTFEYAGDDITTGSDASITVNIKPTPKDTSIISIVSVDGTGLITGSLTVLGNPISNAIVVATMNATNVSLITDNDGLFEFQAINGFEAVFKYAGDFNKTDANASITLNNIAPIPKNTSVIKVVSVDGYGVIVGSLSVDGVAVANATVVASTNGVDINLTTDKDGLFEFQAMNGFETVFKYDGDDTTTASDVAITLNNIAPIPKDTSVINVASVDSDCLITGSLTVLGNPIANATIVATMNGTDTNLTTDDAGLFKFQAINGKEVVFKYAGDNTTASADASFTVNIAQESNITVIVNGKEYPGEVVNGTVVIDIPSENVTVVVNGKEYSGEVVNGTVVIDIPSENVTVVVNGKEYSGEVVNGTVVIDIPAENITVIVDGKEYSAELVNGTVTVKTNGSEPVAPRLASQFNVTAGTSIATYAVDFGVGERGADYKFQLTDSEGKPIVNATVYFAYKTTYFNRTTDENGCVNIGISTQVAGEYLCAMSYLGDETHNATFVPFSFNIQQKSITISAAAKSYKASAKTKKYTVTLKTQKGVDGKTYLKAGKKVTLKINGKTYTAKTNAKGQATFSLKITKKGKYTATINFAGDKTYNAANKKVKITIN